MATKFSQPLGPINALKPAATTTVGRIKGRVARIRKTFFPGNTNLPNKKAAGNPTSMVSNADKVACQMVNPSVFQSRLQSISAIPLLADCTARLKIENRGMNRKTPRKMTGIAQSIGEYPFK